MRKLFLAMAFIIAALIVLPLSAAWAFEPCHPENEKYTAIATRYKTGLLFRIRKCGVVPSYLLATMHSDDPKVIETVGDAFSKLAYANTASFEIIFNDESVKTAEEGMYLSPETIETLQSIVGLGLYNRFVQLMKTVQPNNPESTYYRMKPWAAAVMLQEPADVDDGIALDVKLQNFAKQRGVPIYQLETPSEQMRVFEDVPLAKQIEFLEDTVDNYPQIEKDNQQMFALYFKQDLNGLQELGDKSFDNISDHVFADRLKLDLVDKRNRKMVRNMAEKIDLGGAFVAVGALHLTGKSGILKQLEDKGYYIEVVPDADSVMP